MQKKKASKKKRQKGCTDCGRCRELEQRFKMAKQRAIGEMERATIYD